MKTFNPLEHLIFEGYSGSILYGTNTAESDVDTRGVCLPPMRVMLDPFHGFEIADSFDGEDKAIYSLGKFFKLCADNNPNILELLYVPENFTLRTSWWWQKIVDKRHLFLSKNIKHRFLGYAFSQMDAIKRHREWFINPPDHKPIREEYGLDDVPLATEANMAAILNLPMKMFQEEYLDELNREREYRAAKKQWDNYQQWQKNRNPKRKGSEEKFGYDCYSDNTQFLTENGWKYYFEISDDDKLATVNPITKALEFQFFTNRFSYEIADNIYNIETQDTKVSVTKNHNLFLSPCRRSIKNNFSLKYESEISDWSLVSVVDILDNRRNFYHTLNYTYNCNSDYDVSDEYLTLLGLYVSEGCLLKRDTKKNGVTLKGISLSQLEFPNKIENQIRFLENFYDIHIYKHLRNGRNEITYNIYDKELALKVYNDCAEFHTEKTLPSWITKLSKRQAILLLTAAIAGDGTKYKHSQVYYTVSESLANMMQIVGLLSEKETKIRHYTYESQEIYQVYFSNFYGQFGVFDKNRFVREEFYNGNVVCFEVPNGILVTRLDGKMAFHGNSKYASHLFRLMFEGRDLLLNAELVFPLSEANWLLEVKQGLLAYEEVLELTSEMETNFDRWYEESSLPHKPQTNELEKLYYELLGV